MKNSERQRLWGYVDTSIGQLRCRAGWKIETTADSAVCLSMILFLDFRPTVGQKLFWDGPQRVAMFREK
jgi:hypothetical protein